MNKIGRFMNFWVKNWDADHVKYIKKVSGLGFDILEFQAQALLDMDKSRMDEIRQAAKDNGIELTYSLGLNPKYDVASPDAKVREGGIEYLKRIVERIGMPIRDFFAQQGEARFRQIEAEILAEVTMQTGQIIATGGGIVKDWENVRRLRQSGKVYFLDRSLDQLETDPSRPLSSSREALRQLYDQRIDLYRAACDQQIENNGSADQTARRLWQDWLTETTGLID